MASIISAINSLFNLYFFLIILRIFLSWIPSVNWNVQPFYTLGRIVDVYLNAFRTFVPPINGLDFSPIIAIVVLQIVQYLLIFLLTFVGGIG